MAVFEGRYAVRTLHAEVASLPGRLSTNLRCLRENGRLNAPWDAVRGIVDDLAAYARSDFQGEVASVLQRPDVGLVHPDEVVFHILDDILVRTHLEREDGLDAYVLACVLRSARELPADNPRIFMSLNKKGFSPYIDKAKVPSDLYDDAGLVYIPHFDLADGLQQWQEHFGQAL